MDIVVDFQAFTDNNNQFVIKECAVISVDHSFVEHWIVAPPYSFYDLKKEKRREAVWLKLNHHGLRWDDGGIDYNTFIKELRNVCCGARRIFAKGRQKCAFIEKVLHKEVTDLEEFGAPTLKSFMQTLNPSVLRCFRHLKHKKFICALTVAEKLKFWILNNYHVFK
jgi:hypothetical protein